MKVYQDVNNDVELVSDSHPTKLVCDDLVIEVTSSMVTVGGEDIDAMIGANASADPDAEPEEGVEDKAAKVNSIVHFHRLQSVSLDKKEAKVMVKNMWKASAKALKGKEHLAAQLESLKTNIEKLQDFYKDLLENFDELEFYTAENAALDDGCVLVVARWIGEAEAPTFYFPLPCMEGIKF